MNVALVMTAVGVALGFVLLADVRTPPRTPPRPSSGRRSEGAPGVSLTVIVPARNEEASLPRLLDSLAAQTLVPAEVVVVDDGSADATAAIAAASGARVLSAPPPPSGWVGKPWACHVGSQHAAGEVLVFLDADVVVAPDGLDRIVAAWEQGPRGGLLSVQPFHTTVRAYEQMSAYPNLMSMMASGAFAPGSVRFSPVAFGPCLVTSAEVYRQVGGHETVAGEVIEDVCLARAYGAAGCPVEALAGGSAVSFRMYPSGLRQLVDGWTKNLAGGPRLVSAVPLLGSVAWLVASIVVASGGVQAVVVAARTGRVAWVPIAAWARVAVQLSVLLRRIGAFRWWAGPGFPVLLAGFVVLFVRSVVHRTVRRSVTWHDRTVPVRAP